MSRQVGILLAAFWIFVMQEMSTTFCFVVPSPSSSIRPPHQDAKKSLSPLYKHPPTKIIALSDDDAESGENSTAVSKDTTSTIDEDTATRHMKFMKLALEQARDASKRQEVPIGAVVVQRVWDDNNEMETFRILSQAGNSMEKTNDASAHAEMLVMRRAAKRIKNWRLLNTTLYSTVEPCPMCLSAAQAFRVSEIVYGAPDLRLGAIETYMTMLDDYTHPIHVIDRVVPGVLKNESAEMMRSFFRQRRLEKSTRKDGGGSVKGESQGRLTRWKHRLRRMISIKRQ